MIDLITLKRMLRLNFAEQRRLKAERQAAEAARAAAAAPAEPAEPAKGKPQAKLASLAALMVLAAGLGLAPHGARAQDAAPAATAPAAEATSGTVSAGVRHVHLTLKDLRIKTPIRLAGTRGEIGIPFGLRRSDVVTDASITLHTAWSPALLADLSQLVVLVNGEVVQTIPLRPGDSGGLTLKIPVNPALFLPGDNQLNLRLIGHYARDCEDPFHSSLWANVSNTQSFFDLTVQSVPMSPDLGRLPAPFFDQYDNAPLRLPFVFAGQPSHGELEAAGVMASYFGSQASYRGFGFKPQWGRLPGGDAVVFLKGGASLPGLNVPVTGPAATVVRNPSDPTGTLLVITGRDDAELRLAAGAVASGRGVLGGVHMAFDGARLPSWARYSAPRWLSTDRAVRLGEIMPSYALQGMGIPPGPLSARFRVAPDMFFWPRQGGRLDLGYRYPDASWLDKRSSRLDVSINNQFLKTLPLSGASWWQQLLRSAGANSSDSRASVVLPRYALFGQNELVFDYNLLIADKKQCTGTLPDNVRVALDPNSTIDFTHAYHALQMPDLATFAGAGYPFTVRPDLAETTVLMDQNAAPAVIEAFLNLMGRMGDSTGVATTGLTVVDQVEQGRMEGQDILIIGSSALAQAEALFANAPVRYEGGVLHVRETSPLQYVEALFGGAPRVGGNADDAQGMSYSSRGFTGIVSFESPFTPRRTVVALLADDPTTLPGMVDGMSDDKINAQIQGDMAVVNGDGMAAFALGSTYWVGDLPIWMRLAFWFSQHPLLMAASGLIVALLLTGPAYLYFSRQARRRLASAGDNA